MLGKLKAKAKEVGVWLMKKSPPPIVKFAKNYPKSFKFLVVVSILIPFGLTAFVGLNAFLWLFYLR